MIKSAVISKCGLYRYELRRIWQPEVGLVCWTMLNSSTADANFDDPTVRRCMDYTARWGYGGIIVVNEFALRATDPKNLHECTDPVGPKNDEHIMKANAEARLTIVAWGTQGKYLRRDEHVMMIVTFPHYLTLTKDGSPGHPLRLLKGLDPVPY